MKLTFKSAVGLIGGAVLSATASAYDSIYIFGDSLSDTGNASQFAAAQGVTGIPDRFSNGPVAIDVVASAYGLTATPSLYLFGQEFGNNYAVGGAVAIDADGDEATPDTNLPSQVNAFLNYNAFQADSSALYAVIIGGNDLFAAQAIRAGTITADTPEERQATRQAARARVDQAVESLEAQMLKLISAGATEFLVGNAPDVAQVPNSLDTEAALIASAETKGQTRRAERFLAVSSRLVDRYNRKVARMVNRLERTTGVHITEWDLQSFLSNQIEDAEALGFNNTTDGCIEDFANLPACEGFVFFDAVHPTTAVHTTAGLEVLELLQ